MKVHELFEKFDKYDIHDVTTLPKKKELDSAEKIAKVIRDNCGEMLTAYQKTNNVLYRGMSSYAPAVMTAIRQNRKPAEMPGAYHDVLHQLFLELGLKATRKNSIFCSCSLQIAEKWERSSYIIFVKDGWSGLVFEKTKTDYNYYAMRDIAHDYQDQRIEKPEALAKIQKLKPLEINNASALEEVLRKKYEDVLITGDSYLALSVENSLTKKVLKLLKIEGVL